MTAVLPPTVIDAKIVVRPFDVLVDDVLVGERGGLSVALLSAVRRGDAAEVHTEHGVLFLPDNLAVTIVDPGPLARRGDDRPFAVPLDEHAALWNPKRGEWTLWPSVGHALDAADEL